MLHISPILSFFVTREKKKSIISVIVCKTGTIIFLLWEICNGNQDYIFIKDLIHSNKLYPLFVKVLQEIDFIDCQIFQMSVIAHKVVHTELMKYIAMRMTHAILIYQEPLKAFPQINII